MEIRMKIAIEKWREIEKNRDEEIEKWRQR
jgi:hypothetical protein